MTLPAGCPAFTSQTTVRPVLQDICSPCQIRSAEELCFVCGAPMTVLWRQGEHMPMDFAE